jgi:hypothetical protein
LRGRMAQHAKTRRILAMACEVLAAQHPMTVRQVYSQLVSRQVIETHRGQYQAVSHALVDGRQDGTMPWEWMEDRLRQPRDVVMWDTLAARVQRAVFGYRRNVWPWQPRSVEVWREKDALSGIFVASLRRDGVTLNVGRGYDRWDSIHRAAERYRRSGQWTGAAADPAILDAPDELIPTTILDFGDFDPSGEDVVRSLGERLRFLGVDPVIKQCALTADDKPRHNFLSAGGELTRPYLAYISSTSHQGCTAAGESP